MLNAKRPPLHRLPHLFVKKAFIFVPLCLSGKLPPSSSLICVHRCNLWMCPPFLDSGCIKCSPVLVGDLQKVRISGILDADHIHVPLEQ